MYLSLELLETPALLAGRIDPPWSGWASGFVQAEVGGLRRVGSCDQNPPGSNQNTPTPLPAISADTQASTAKRGSADGGLQRCVCMCV